MLNVPGGLCISFCNFDSYDEDDKYFIRLAPLMAPQQRETVMQSRARGGGGGRGREILGESLDKKITKHSCHVTFQQVEGGGSLTSHTQVWPDSDWADKLEIKR